MNTENSQPIPKPTFKITENRYINIYSSINQPEMPTGKIHSDQTGQFPIKSSSGKIYMMVIYEYDSNPILVELLTDTSK